ncbi:MAG: PEP-CTERM sorting domain-containing protein [Cyanobacteria bacterium P01_H01_bin.35]
MEQFIYIVAADTVGTPNGDFVYRTVDLNNDGDANDMEEASIWLDLKALNPASSAFEIAFIDDVAFISDTAGGSPRVYRAEDINNDEVIDPLTEVNIFIHNTNPFGIGTFYFGLDSDSTSVYGLDLFSDSIFRLTDKNDSGSIDLASEALKVWEPSNIPTGFDFGVGAFSVATSSSGELSITSNGSQPNEDNVFRLIDLNGDGDYLDADETTIYLSRELTGFFPVRPRVVEYAKGVPEPTTLLGVLGMAGFMVGSALSAFSKKVN